ncbi:MAG: hypothetical protein R6U32_03360 [Candidatus Woesearchaeota archaeon]
MEYRTRKRMKEGMKGAGYGAVACAGIYMTGAGMSYSWDEMSRENETFDSAITSLKEACVSGEPPSEADISGLTSEISGLNSLNLRDKSENHLDGIVNSMQSLQTSYDPESVSEQGYARKTIIEGRDDLMRIKEHEETGNTNIAATSLMLGGAMLIAGGWMAIEKFYRAIKGR